MRKTLNLTYTLLTFNLCKMTFKSIHLKDALKVYETTMQSDKAFKKRMTNKPTKGLDKRIEDYLMKEEGGLWGFENLKQFILKERDNHYIKGLNDGQKKGYESGWYDGHSAAEIEAKNPIKIKNPNEENFTHSGTGDMRIDNWEKRFEIYRCYFLRGGYYKEVKAFIKKELDRVREGALKGKFFNKIEINEEINIPEEILDRVREEERKKVAYRLGRQFGRTIIPSVLTEIDEYKQTLLKRLKGMNTLLYRGRHFIRKKNIIEVIKD